ncbi:acyl-CoA dehydrogenase family protein [Streptomyces chiangmaiensis]|uniref:Acyl-CoA dehydrogenase family protein n=1 Tax=Streptomyces chiangmaiensis TaxID=766497 RepID=A0ABU7FIX9_9ACTN|nr:acyl-CoA dehydrogenase family protein [Streptomyces chiangmaiensis]MED7823936.1 acyl-CoA dehydrogenase family protein [Streptomyces chiangmaiensis]
MSYRSALAHVLSSAIKPSAEETGTRERFPRASVTALGAAGLLGLTVASDLGGGGLNLFEATEVVTEVSRVCPATGAVLRSHYAAVAFIEAYGTHWMRRKVAVGHHLSTLALTDAGETGSPGGTGATATRTGDVVALRGRKRDVVAAGEADSYIWSARPADGGEGQALWLVPADAPGLFVPARPSGEGPRGSGTSTVCADPVLVPAGAMLERDGTDDMLSTVCAWLAAVPAPGAEVPAGPVDARALT